MPLLQNMNTTPGYVSDRDSLLIEGEQACSSLTNEMELEMVIRTNHKQALLACLVTMQIYF